MVVEIELDSLEEYESKILLEDDDFLDELKRRFPKIWGCVLEEFQDFCELCAKEDEVSCKKYSEKELRELFTVDEFVDAVEDYYYNGEDKPDILINYYVRDSIGTDRGIWEQIVANGYEFIEESK